MKTISYEKMAMTFAGILIATLAAGCSSDGGSGYYNRSYGYNSNYSSYGSSYPYSNYDRGYSHPQSYGNSYNAGYQNGVRADENRERREHRAVARTETRHTSIDRTESN